MTLVRAFATVGSYTMLSRVLGFVRDILIAAGLGAGPVADAFFVAFKLPNFFRRLFAEGAFNAGFVPLFSGLLESEGRAAAQRFAEQALSVLLLTLLIFVSAMQAGMPWAMKVLAPGFIDEPEKFELAVVFTRLTFSYLLFISLVSLLGGVLNSLQRFAAVAATPVLLNVCLIIALTVAAPYLESPGHALSWGVAAAGAVQFVWLILAARRAGMILVLPWPRLTPKVRELLRLMAPAALAVGVVQVNLLVDLILASLLPEGSVSYLFYADRLNQLPIGVVGVAAGTALLPMLSRQVAAGREDEARASLNRAIELILLLSLPAAAALLAVPGELVAGLFERGHFGAQETRLTTYALTAYATGLPAYVLVKVLAPAYFARRDTRAPVIYGVIAMLANLVGNLILMQYLAHAGLALATALSAWLNIALLSWGLRSRGYLVVDARLKRRVAGAFAATLVMTAAVLAAAYLTAPMFGQGETVRIGGLAIIVIAGMLAFAVAGRLLGAYDATEVRRLLRR
jgi:putative peptidoglycan lipid II flippase